MSIKLFLLFAACLCLVANSLKLEHSLRSATCLEKSIGLVEVDPNLNYVIKKSWSQEDPFSVKEGVLSALDFVEINGEHKSEHYLSFFQQVTGRVSRKFDQQYFPITQINSNNGSEYGLSSAQFSSTFGSSQLPLYQVKYRKTITLLKFSVKGSQKDIGGWNVLISCDQTGSQDYVMMMQEQRISQLLKTHSVTSQDIISAFKIDHQTLAKHVMLAFDSPQDVQATAAVEFEASIVILQAEQFFIASKMNTQSPSLIRVIDTVADRSNCGN